MLFNYVFIFEDVNYAKVQYNDLSHSANAQFIPLAFNLWKKNRTNIFNLLSHIHFSTKINNVIFLPFKNIWKNKLFNFKYKESLDKSKPFCFIIHARCYEKFGSLLLDYLRKEQKDCKIILYFTDLVSNHRIMPDKIRSCFDLIFTIEKGDAKKYNLIFCNNPYSIINTNSTIPKSDVFFIGRAKNRLKTIFEVYERLTNNGLICDFIITGADKKNQLYRDKIQYLKYVDYYETLNHLAAAQCLLEILQEGAYSPTLRPLEAVCYNKKLLTNCTEITGMDYFNQKYMSIFKNADGIDIDFIKNKNESINYDYAKKLSPIEMVKNIEYIIQRQGA